MAKNNTASQATKDVTDTQVAAANLSAQNPDPRIAELEKEVSDKAVKIAELENEVSYKSAIVAELEADIEALKKPDTAKDQINGSKSKDGKLLIKHGVKIPETGRTYTKEDIAADADLQKYLLEIGSTAVEKIN